MQQQTNPILAYEFKNKSGKIVPLVFSEPVKVIQAEQLEEVIPCLQQVEEAVHNGYYAAGYVSYESAPAFDPAFKVVKNQKLPLIWFGIFNEPEQRVLTSNSSYQFSKWNPSVSMDEYKKAIGIIKDKIKDGITYQTNYTIRMNSDFTGDDLAYYTKLKQAQASNYCAYLQLGDVSILSASPELFFHIEEDTITTKPMKGTVKRGKTTEEDDKLANWLYQSEKNRAENVMIVDLLRNDLGHLAVPGTVSVPKLFEIETYPTVHQMTSTVQAQLVSDTTLIDIFKAIFPCGSITGAPKISTMDLIASIETTPREVYCGAIGYITPMKEAIFNVPIRTVIIDKKSQKATYGVGGGITWDSTTEGEYDEVLAKATLLTVNKAEFQLLESLRLENGSYFLFNEHLHRLKKSADYFGYEIGIKEVSDKLLSYAKTHQDQIMKVRLLVSKNGNITIEGTEIYEIKEPVPVSIAHEPIDKENSFLYHKTTNRDIYTYFQKNKPEEAFDVLLWNENDELTEFTNGNIVLEIDGTKYTPPIASGLLGGTFREKLLKEEEIFEKTLALSDLKKSSKVWFINSVRKWIEVQFIEKGTE